MLDFKNMPTLAWEYKWASDRDYEDNLEISNLNALGAEGWEVAGMCQDGGETCDILMKRAKGWVPRDPEPTKTAAEEAREAMDRYSDTQLDTDGLLRPISRFDSSIPDATGTCVVPSVEVPHVG